MVLTDKPVEEDHGVMDPQPLDGHEDPQQPEE